MTENGETFEIQRPQVQRYFYWSAVLMLTIIGLFMWLVGVVGAVIYAFTLGPWLSRRQTAVLEYRLHATHLFVHQGVFFVKRKTIPLDRITDIVLSQGPLLRWFGIWRLDIQTAGSGQQHAEAYLYGLVDPEQAKENILKARDTISIGGKNTGF